MDVINQIQLPPALEQYSSSSMLIFLLALLVVLAIIVTLAAFIVNAPKSGFFRAFFAVVLQMALTITTVIILINIKEPPNSEGVLIVMFISAMVAFSTCFATSIIKGAIITVVAGVMYFLVYKCGILLLQTQYPDIYAAYIESVANLLTQYQYYRY